MFQAEAGKGNAASVRTRDETSDTAASYAIPDEQGARKKVQQEKRFWTIGNESQ
jgi:hypothetical protein